MKTLYEDCFLLNNLLFQEHDENLKFKIQRIWSPNGSLVGSELLLDSSCNTRIFLTNIVQLGTLGRVSIEYVFNRFNSLKETGRTFFLNMERLNMCDIPLLKSIVNLHLYLSSLDVKLVIEITERNTCGACSRIIDGLFFLKQAGVSLALDDYDYINEDFRLNELLSGFYDIIKVNAPKTPLELEVLTLFYNAHLKNTNMDIVVERVEQYSELAPLNKSMNIWGIQGFLFCKGLKF